MKVKKVNQYQCEYCGKKQYSASHMKKHEQHCTMNPDRHCRMCGFLEIYQVEMRKMLNILPDIKQFLNPNFEFESYRNHEKPLKEAIEELRTFTECPMCIYSALRQKGIYLTMVRDWFDLKSECHDIFEQANNERYEREMSENFNCII